MGANLGLHSDRRIHIADAGEYPYLADKIRQREKYITSSFIIYIFPKYWWEF
jgi:hypothetical protein